MRIETIEYVDFNNETRTEDFYFNLTDAETMMLQLGEDGGLSEKIHRVIERKDIPTIMELFEKFVDISYGIKSPDGREFVKSEEITRSFKQTNAYSKLFIRLCTEKGFAEDFFNSIIPTDSLQDITKQK